MPMLHGCAFPGCTTLTLSTYCVEHELLIRALKESERQHEATPVAADHLSVEHEPDVDPAEPAAL